MALTAHVTTRVTDTDDDGSGTTGTIHNNAWKQQIYQSIDDYIGDTVRGLLTGRIYVQSGKPSWQGVTGSFTTLFFGPAATKDGAAVAPGLISLYDGSQWDLYTFTEISLALTGLTNGSSYDIFVYNNAGTLTLEAVVWSGATTPSSTTTQDGVEVQTGAASKRYVGSVHINGGAGTLTINGSTSPVWNAYNQVELRLRATEATADWTYMTDNVWRPANNNTANRITHMVGRAIAAGSTVTAPVRVFCSAPAATLANGHANIAIGVNSTSTPDTFCLYGHTRADFQTQIVSELIHTPAVGYNFYQWLEFLITGAGAQFVGSNYAGIQSVVRS